MAGCYATVAEAQGEGVPSTIDPKLVQAQLVRWSQFMDAATKQWFEPRDMSLMFDGNDSRTLFFPIPIISISAFYMNGDFTNKVDPKLFAVYNRNDQLRDDRRNPMIKLAGSGLGIFDAADFRRGAMFCLGEQNQRVDGQFGFVEPDKSTPSLIKRAVLKLTIRSLRMSGTGKLWDELGNGPPTQGNITAETTDGHSISYNAFSMQPIKAGLNGITNDPEVDQIINLYKGPIKIAATPSRGGPDRRW